jgi:uncharacterized OsmC-like protein
MSTIEDTTTPETAPDNGIAIDHLVEVRGHIAEAPELGAFQWRARTQWVNGARCRTSFDTFSGAGGEQAHRKTFTYEADHPELFQQSDEEVTPVEFVLHALGSCITAGIASVGAARGIRVDAATATIEGDMDVRGILGIDREVRNGYSQIRVGFTVRGDAPAEELRKVVRRATERSAVYDIVTNPTDVVVEVEVEVDA